MNYKLMQRDFIPLNEKIGLIENYSNGIVEIKISEKDKEVCTKHLNPNDKFSYSLKTNQKIEAKIVNRLAGMINVVEMFFGDNGNNENASSNQSVDLSEYVKKTDVENFVKKKRGKVLSDNNFSDEYKNKLDKIKENMGSMNSSGRKFTLHYCTEMEYQSMGRPNDDSIIYLVLNEITGSIEMRVSR